MTTTGRGMGNRNGRGVLAACGRAAARAAVGLSLMAPLPAAAGSFESWLEGFWPRARAEGVSRQTFTAAFAGVTPDPEVIEAAQRQPEFVKPMWEYLASAVSERRIANGRAQLAELANLLTAIETIYGVDRHVVVAIWGMESSYGQFLGTKSVIRSLATLSYTGTRRRFGEQQLLAALRILQRGDTTPERMYGSWAGAMGHTQFIPTTYNAYAVDFDGDGRRDIWDTVADALASTANYLRASGWQPGLPWGWEVTLPRGFDFGYGGEAWRPAREWQAAGVRRADGGALGRGDETMMLVLPAGARGPAFLVSRNFRAILRYNNATAYALAVGHLADRLGGAGPLVAAWPTDERPLGTQERRELQGLLAARGYAVGAIDGIIGSRTQAAIRAFQRRAGLPADGYASTSLLDRLRIN